jgi:hypothetical protein
VVAEFQVVEIARGSVIAIAIVDQATVVVAMVVVLIEV